MTAVITPVASVPPRPGVGPLKNIKLPSVADSKLKNGLRVLAARRAGVPRVELRLSIPIARGGSVGDQARLRVLAKTLLSGTSKRSATDIAEELQRIGGSLDAGVDAEDLALFGSCLAGDLDALLALMAEVLTDAIHPAEEVGLEKERIGQEIELARSQPAVIASEALRKRLYPKHPYGRPMPTRAQVAKVTVAQLKAEHAQRLHPEGSVLVIVGDVRPDAAVAAAEAAVGGWRRGRSKAGLEAPVEPKPQPILLVDRPGAVQTNIRLGGAGIGRSDPEYPALALANLVFGGYFIARLVDNIREEKGYTYSPGSGVSQSRQAAWFQVVADVGTEVTAPALVEIRYELERMTAGPITGAELTSAKRYLAGTMSMSIGTQAGLASYLSTLAYSGLSIEYLRDFPKAVEALTERDVILASRRFLAPHRLSTVLVGDAAAVQESVEAFGPVEVIAAG